MIETSGHLPECTLAPGACLAPGPHQEADGFCWKCHLHCVCDRLRACEQRVEESMDRAWTHTLRIKQAEAYAAGVQAARDAVKGVCHHDDPDEWCIFLDAIDGLQVDTPKQELIEHINLETP